jgi:hypothetical protein
MWQGSMNVGGTPIVADGATLMLTALVLICSLASVPDLAACTRDNALEVLRVPATFASPVTCLMHGQAYLADTSIGRDLAQDEAVKIICVRGKAAEDTSPTWPTKAQLQPDAGLGR